MKISTDSWHYLAIDMLGWVHPGSLCPYFWKAMFATLLIVGISCLFGLVAGAWVTVPVLLVTSFIIEGPSIFGMFGGNDSVGFTVTFGLMFWAITLWIVGLRLWIEFKESAAYEAVKDKLPKRKERVKKPDGLFMAFLKASHQKVCPHLEFFDKESRV
jgi:hypothetical protein